MYSVAPSQKDDLVDNNSKVPREPEMSTEVSDSKDSSWLTSFIGDDTQVRLKVAKVLRSKEQCKDACYNCGETSHRVRECPLLKHKPLNAKAALTSKLSQGLSKMGHKKDQGSQ